MREHAIKIGEEDRQLLLLSLALATKARPGFFDALRRLAGDVPGGLDLFDRFLETMGAASALRCHACGTFVDVSDLADAREAHAADAEGLRKLLVEMREQHAREVSEFHGEVNRLLSEAAAKDKAHAKELLEKDRQIGGLQNLLQSLREALAEARRRAGSPI